MFEWILNGGGVPEVIGEYVKVGEWVSDASRYGFVVASSSHGRFVAITSDNTGPLVIYEWSGSEYVEIQTFDEPDEFGRCVSFIGDGDKLLVGSKGKITVLHWVGVKYIVGQVLSDNPAFGYSLTHTLNGDRIISAHDMGTVSAIGVWSLQGDTYVRTSTLPGHTNSVGVNLTVSADGRFLTSSGGNTKRFVWLWNGFRYVSNGATLSGLSGFGRWAITSQDGSRLLISEPSTGKLYNYVWNGSRYVLSSTFIGRGQYGIRLSGSVDLEYVVGTYSENSEVGVTIYESLGSGFTEMVTITDPVKRMGAAGLNMSSSGNVVLASSWPTGKVMAYRREGL